MTKLIEELREWWAKAPEPGDTEGWRRWGKHLFEILSRHEYAEFKIKQCHADPKQDGLVKVAREMARKLDMLEVAGANEWTNALEKVISNYRPVPDNALVEALEKLARLGNGTEYGNSEGNRIAQEALARHKEGTPSVHKSDMSTPREQSEEMNTAPASLVEKLEKEKALIDTTNYPEDFINGYDRAIYDLKEILK